MFIPEHERLLMFKDSGKKPRPKGFMREPLPNRKRGDNHEAAVAKIVNGRTQPGSGSGPFQSIKGDVVSDSYLYQCKLTDKNRFTITEPVLAEINRQAKVQGKFPVVVVKMEAIKEPTPIEWVCIPMEVWREVSKTND